MSQLVEHLPRNLPRAASLSKLCCFVDQESLRLDFSCTICVDVHPLPGTCITRPDHTSRAVGREEEGEEEEEEGEEEEEEEEEEGGRPRIYHALLPTPLDQSMTCVVCQYMRNWTLQATLYLVHHRYTLTLVHLDIDPVGAGYVLT